MAEKEEKSILPKALQPIDTMTEAQLEKDIQVSSLELHFISYLSKETRESLKISTELLRMRIRACHDKICEINARKNLNRRNQL